MKGAVTVRNLFLARWTTEIVLFMGDQPNFRPPRFNQMLANVKDMDGLMDISDRVLTQRLRDLEAAKLVTRDVTAGPPVMVRYALTAAGVQLYRSLADMKKVLEEVG